MLIHKQKTNLNNFDKYEYYRLSVQSPDVDTEFFEKVYYDFNARKKPETLREDFCGTFLLSCEWVKRGKSYRALAIDLDPEPLDYGRRHNLSKLSTHQQSRLHLVKGDVLDSPTELVDILAAMNFSYFIFKTRSQMKKYLQKAFQGLKKNGVLILDCFGGSLCYDANLEKTKLKNFTYFWEQEGYDPISHEAHFHIHFKPHGKKKIAQVFSYDWRLWTIAELRELLVEVGFSETHVYWEGNNKKGGGNGVFTRAQKGEECQSWIAYITAKKI